MPSKAIDIIDFNAILELGAFGGVNDSKDNLYLAIGANGTVKGVLKIPENSKIWGGKVLRDATINLIAGGQTTFPIRGVDVNTGMKNAFKNIDMYLGAVAETHGRIFDARAWVLIPHIVRTNFRRKGGWDFEVKLHNRLSSWDWEDKGVTPVVQSSGMTPVLLSLSNSMVTSADIEVNANADETPYILLSFDENVTEEEIKASLNIDNLTVNWTQDGEIDPSADINAATDIMANNKDGKNYRVVILRLNSGGSYHIDTGNLPFNHEEAAVTPFEKLNLAQNADGFTGKVDYPQENTKYVLRTYLANEKGDADYIIDERTLDDPESIDITVPVSGVSAPTGEYYITTFLMTEKQADINDDGEVENALAAIASFAFDNKVSYTNTNEPSAPGTASLEAVGNEVMRAAWDPVNEADGYAVRIYQEENGQWIDTGFGYDLDKNTNTIDMAVTVGGNGVSVSESNTSASSVPAENLSADKNYKVGVKAYKKIDDGKYYSAETESAEEYLPKYTPLEIELSINGNVCSADENGIFNAYLGKGSNTLTASLKNGGNAVFRMIRMDTNTEITPENNEYPIPDFEGTLMFQIDGISGKDVTSEYLLVSLDKQPPSLSLSSDVFYADKTSGEYKITGAADAGSIIMYDENEETFAGSEGAFEISGALDESTQSEFISIQAKDSAGNTSVPRIALVMKQTSNTVTVNNSYAQNSGSGEYNKGETVTINAGTNSGYTFTGWTSDSGITFADSKKPETTFTMPDGNVTVTANWSRTSSGGGGGGAAASLNVSFDTNGGSKVSSQNVTKNTSASEPASPVKDGYDFAGWYSDKELTVKYDFSAKVTKNITLYAAWVEKGAAPDTSDWKNPFIDVSEKDWFFENIKYAVNNNLMNGITDTVFEPNGLLSRAMLVTILWRANGKPQTDYIMPFDDIDPNSYYAEAVRWAASEGIIDGISENEFAPDSNITREQIAAIMFRYAKYKGYDTSAGENTNILSYEDYDNISEYAIAPIQYAVGTGLMNGKTDSSINPSDNASRAEIAAIMQRFFEADIT